MVGAGNGQDEAKRLRLTLVDSEYGTVQMNEYISPDDIGAYKQGAVVQVTMHTCCIPSPQLLGTLLPTESHLGLSDVVPMQAVPLFTGGIAVLAADHLIAIRFEAR